MRRRSEPTPPLTEGRGVKSRQESTEGHCKQHKHTGAPPPSEHQGFKNPQLVPHSLKPSQLHHSHRSSQLLQSGLLADKGNRTDLKSAADEPGYQFI
ncbi:hypothetical protein INR49_016109 [Caranx melampygus]|nr:hypothetical protein INR49_016109 [Caranx melampygus]